MRCAVRACTAHTHVTKASLKGGIVWPGITSHIIGQVLLSLGHHVRGDNIICVRVLIWDEFGIAVPGTTCVIDPRAMVSTLPSSLRSAPH